ncbi:MAG: XrtA/PEP-CTERM system histidine kinase PrsK [Gammaproteobacteria bacterium]
MENFIYYSYLSCAISYLILFVFTLQRKGRNVAFIIASLFSAIWSSIIVYTSENRDWFLADTLIFETIRNIAWLVLLTFLMSKQRLESNIQFITQTAILRPIGFIALFTLSIEIFPSLLSYVRSTTTSDPRFFFHVLFAITGLIVIEQLYRNTPLTQRWNVKFICLGLGAIFTFDLLVYSKSLLYQTLDMALWQSRGFINTFATPLLAIGIHRLDSIDLSTTRTAPKKTVFYTSILFGSGLYLILMSATGYYLKHSNAQWGETLQILFIFLSLLLLAIAFTSGKIRALAKVYFGKHFFQYNYDYRQEWLKISTALAQLETLDNLKTFIINTLTNLVDSSGGGLWLKNDQGHFFLAAEHNLRLTPRELEQLKNGHDLPDYLANKQWVIDFFELAHAPEIYDDIDLSPWCYEDSQVWLIVPLFHMNHLEAFVVLTQPRAPRKLNWEDHDLLKTVGMQLANAIALTKASEALANSRQFEAYHRLSAYLVHDLKNIAAQISLIVKNAERHKHNPDFFDDTIETLNNAVSKMQHIVEQLKQGKPASTPSRQINLIDLIKGIVSQHSGHPAPDLETNLIECPIKADPSKLTSVITNLIQNAQDATRSIPNGSVKIVISGADDYAEIKIIDNGIGMDHSFIAERLFKPFDTTKGNAGMGIGAYEAKDYILKINGHLKVESQPGKGTTFSLYLPLAITGNNEPN